MAESILIQGKRGSGKTLSGCQIVDEYLARGVNVAANINLFIEHLSHPTSTSVIHKIPNMPSIDDFKRLPVGNPELMDEHGNLLPEDKQPELFDESKNSLLWLDEPHNFLNSRDWNSDQRKSVLSFMSESRKYGYDLLLTTLHIDQLDSVIRKGMVDIVGYAKDSSKIAIPFITTFIYDMTGYKLRLPKGTIVNFFAGVGQSAPFSYRLKIFGTKYFKAYRTNARVNTGSEPNQLTQNSIYEPNAPYTIISHWLLKGRYMSPFTLYRSKFLMVAFLGLASGFAISNLTQTEKKPQQDNSAIAQTPPIEIEQSHIIGKFETAGITKLVLSDGNSGIVQSVNSKDGAIIYKVNNKWYSEKSPNQEAKSNTIMSTVGL